MAVLTLTQELFLQLIERMSFNKCDGSQIVAALRDNKHLWRSAIPTRPVKPVLVPLQNPVINPTAQPSLLNRVDLIVLRDLPDDSVNLDTVVVWSEPGQQVELEKLALVWKPDELTWYKAKEAFRAMGAAGVKHREYALDDPTLLVAWWA